MTDEAQYLHEAIRQGTIGRLHEQDCPCWRCQEWEAAVARLYELERYAEGIGPVPTMRSRF